MLDFRDNYQIASCLYNGEKRNLIDSGLDLTPVRDSQIENFDSNEIKSFQQRVNNLNIKPIEVEFLSQTNNFLIKKQITETNPNLNSSDTDTSVQAKCCVNPFKWLFIK
jgi:hypothetical protein